MGWEEWARKAGRRGAVEAPSRRTTPEHKLATFAQAVILSFYRLHQASVRERFGPLEFNWPCQQGAYPITSRTEPIVPVRCAIERLAIARGCLPGEVD